MPWWLSGASAFMFSFSAWTFTGAASKAYQDGPIIYIVYLGNALGYLLGFLVFGSIFRRMRTITALEAVRQRFGRANEQVLTWAQLPIGILYAGIWLNGLGVFMATVLKVDLHLTVLVAGMVVLIISFFSGSYGVMANDFIQTLILIPITLVACFYSLSLIEPVQLVRDLPIQSILGNNVNYPMLAVAWCIVVVIKNGVISNNIQNASRYLSSKTEKHARKAALLAMILFIIGPIIWFIPPMVTSILYPNLGEIFPNLSRPTEAAFLVVPMRYFPKGLLGILVCSLLAATMSSMDSGLNRNTGFFIRNFYLSILRPHAHEKELMIASKTTTLVFGLLIISCALFFSSLKNIGLFDMMLLLGGLIAFPVTIPMFWGLFVRKGPDWICWTTVLLGLSISVLGKFVCTAQWFRNTFNLPVAFSAREMVDYSLVFAVGMCTVVCSGYFMLMSFIFRKHQLCSERQAAVEEFSRNITTPLPHEETEDDVSTDRKTCVLISRLCISYGAFICLLFLIPNPPAGRLAFIFCGGVLVAVGLLIGIQARPRKENVFTDITLSGME